MARLLLFLDGARDWRNLEAGFYLLPRAGAALVPQALGDEAIFLRGGPRKAARYAGVGRLTGLRPITSDPPYLRVDVEGLRRLDPPPLQTVARGNAVMELTDPQFGELLRQIDPSGTGVRELAELLTQAAYQGPVLSDEQLLRAVAETVKREYGFTCGLVGKKLAPEELRVAVIRPKPLGGSLHVNNCLALCPEADAAFAAGHFTVRDNGRIIVDKSRINPALLAAINETGRMLWPDNPALRPTPDNLDYHRRYVFGLH